MSLAPTDFDIYLFHEGTHHESYKAFGAHPATCGGQRGVKFTVWAPNAQEVRLVGDFNGWDGTRHQMEESAGIWSTFIPGLEEGELYKYEIYTSDGQVFLKADPYAFYSELRPGTASVVYDLSGYEWEDAQWMKARRQCQVYDQPALIYEVHPGSWRRKEDGSFLTYRELADELVPYVKKMGYTHIELLPVVEHPYDRSWGYQATGYYSVTSRYGTPHDFMYFVDRCHQNGIGVILDWVPGHFCKDANGLARFDGTPLYEYADPQRSENAQWGTANFDLGKPEVISFLISNALFWFQVYHIDGLRVDAVANILYLNYAKPPGQSAVNKYGGWENLEGIAFLRKLNKAVFERFPDVLMIAEDSTAWPQVTHPTYLGGLGFNYKWNMGWMNDVLEYMQMDPIHRKWSHNKLTFSLMYAFSENFVLPLSHDEVVHGKRSLLNKMPGDYWQKFANLRLLYGYFLTHPGKKLIFMGAELAQFDEWKDFTGLDWFLLDFDLHRRFHTFTRDINVFYRKEPALWEADHVPEGFEWIDPHDYSQSIITFLRRGHREDNFCIVICNFTPVVRTDYRIGVPMPGRYQEVFNSDLQLYGGSGQKNFDLLMSEEVPWHDRPYSLRLRIPPLAMVVLKPEDRERKGSDDNAGEQKGNCRHVIGRRRRKSARGSDRENRQTGGTVWREVPDHRLYLK